MSIKHIVFIVPGFAKDEADFLCAPPLQQLVLELQKTKKVEISILAIHYPYAPKQYAWNGINVVALGGNNARGLRKLTFFRQAISFLNELNRKQPIHAVHSFWLSDASLVGSRWAKKNGVEHFITLMGQEAETAKNYRRFVKSRDHIIALSTEQRSRIEAQLNLRVKQIIPFGIQRETVKDEVRTTDVLGVGSLIEVKNYRQFIETIAHLQKEGFLNVKLIGDGPQREELENYAQEKNVKIEFLGIIDRTQVLAEMGKAKVLFHPSNSESLGYVFLEALMCGMGIVSKKVGIAGDVTSKNWTVVENDDFQMALTEQLSREIKRIPELPILISNTAQDYLKLWEIK